MSTPDNVLAAAAGLPPGAQATGTQQAQPATPPPAAPAQPPETTPQSIPYDRFREVNEKAKAAEAEAAELRKWKADQEAAQLSEVERATKAREDAEQRATAAEERATRIERSSFVRDAARAAGFADPDDAVAFLEGQLKDIGDRDAAKAAVTDLAEKKAHLLSGNAPATPTPIGGLTPRTPTGEVPLGADGQPDVKAGLGADLLRTLTGRK